MRLEKEARSSFTEKKKQVQMKAQKRLTNTKEDLWSKEDKLRQAPGSVLKEANTLLHTAMKVKEVSIAEAVQKRISNANPVMKQTGEKQRSVSKRKQAIITFLLEPSKPKSMKS